jgi:hypothetical protein
MNWSNLIIQLFITASIDYESGGTAARVLTKLFFSDDASTGEPSAVGGQ